MSSMTSEAFFMGLRGFYLFRNTADLGKAQVGGKKYKQTVKSVQVSKMIYWQQNESTNKHWQMWNNAKEYREWKDQQYITI